MPSVLFYVVESTCIPLLSRQRSRVRVSSSPPFFPKGLQPNFTALVNQPTEIPLAAHDQILRMRNGPDIALFLSFAPDVCSNLCKMDPVKAAETIEDISHDLDYGNIPTERIGYSVWKEARNREKAPKTRKR